MRKRRERERERERKGRRVERQWEPLSLGVNSSELVGALKRNYFFKIHLFPFCNFLGPHFLISFPLVTSNLIYP